MLLMINAERRLIHVAAAVILDPSQRILLARRPDDKHQGGLWEFPGGKVEAGEPVLDALDRELDEELGIRVRRARPLIQIPHHYADKSVLLDVFVVDRFDGEPHGREGQPVRWVSAQALSDYSFPAANRPIVAAAQLPDRLLITGEAADTAHYRALTQRALEQGIRWVMLRAPALAPSAFADVYHVLKPLCDAAGATLAVNAELALANELQAQALHLSSARLAQLSSRADFSGRWLSASCHNASELARAAALELDFVTLSPVALTASHPDVSPMGWPGFAQLCAQATVPVFALGGMKAEDLSVAQAQGAQGIAAISQWWEVSDV